MIKERSQMINFSLKWFNLKLAFKNFFRKQWKANNQFINKFYFYENKDDYSNKKSNKTN